MEYRKYMCIDLKSFYASVECVERGLDPMTTNLVVADPERTDKTICLAVTPAMKKLGVKNRCRVFEIPKNVEYITASPRMRKYIEYSADVYEVYLDFFSKDDIYVYSIDEAFIEVTNYLKMYKMTPRELGKAVMDKIYRRLGIRATCGIGTNLYLAKIALDITAKHAKDFIGELDEEKYRRTMWEHKPLTDFWRIGIKTAQRLEKNGMYTMGDVARMNEELLYSLFGIDAELLIDHAWGREPVTIRDIKAYTPKTRSLTRGQVLMSDYTFSQGKTVIKEMADSLCLELIVTETVISSVTIYVGYSNSLSLPMARGSFSFRKPTSAVKEIVSATEEIYCRCVNSEYPVRRLNVCFNNVEKESEPQYSLFENPEISKRNKALGMAIAEIKLKYGKNAILKGIDFFEESTARERNRQIGGHKSGEKT